MSTTKAESLRKWSELPENLHRTKAEKQHFKSLSETEQQRALMLGGSQTQRCNFLRLAARAGDSERVTKIISAGVDVDARNEYGQTALFLAAWNGHPGAVSVLLKYGASELPAFGGCLPFAAAATNKHFQVCDLLSTEFCTNDRCFQSKPCSIHPFPMDIHQQHVSCTTTPYETFYSASPLIQRLLACSDSHPGAGSVTIDHAFAAGLISRLLALQSALPFALEGMDDYSKTRRSTEVKRQFFCDTEGWFLRELQKTLALVSNSVKINPFCRFISYEGAGPGLAPHVDLPKLDEEGCYSTHTWVLYLRDTETGGRTLLLESLAPGAPIRAAVSPRVGRLLLFPHACPHAGESTMRSSRKLIFRGECMLSMKDA